MKECWNFARRHNALWRRVAFGSLWLNGVWEVIQCFAFYDMSRVSPLGGAFWMVGATIADVGITLILLALTTLLFRPKSDRLSPTALLFLVFSGALTALIIEIIAQKFGWWRYAPTMPVLWLGNHSVGILPLLQMAILPALAASLPSRR